MADKIQAFTEAINEKFESEAACARALGWARQRLNKITTGQMKPDVDDVNALSAVLEISVGDVCSFFITN